MRLIDKERLKNRFQEECGRLKCNRWDISAILDEIDNAPTITPLSNGPLTLEELREMDGEPMWISGERIGRYDICCGISSDNVVQFYKTALPIYSYGRTWLAYRRKPEEVQT